MRRRKAEWAKYFGSNEEFNVVTGYTTVNIPRFKHKKKPISMIRALELHEKLKEKIK